jgi:hypothetical protein
MMVSGPASFWLPDEPLATGQERSNPLIEVDNSGGVRPDDFGFDGGKRSVTTELFVTVREAAHDREITWNRPLGHLDQMPIVPNLRASGDARCRGCAMPRPCSRGPDWGSFA